MQVKGLITCRFAGKNDTLGDKISGRKSGAGQKARRRFRIAIRAALRLHASAAELLSRNIY
jgi:hypothetical protein